MRVRLGMARTFQINQLFLDLTPISTAGEQPDGRESKHPERDLERRPARTPRQIRRPCS